MFIRFHKGQYVDSIVPTAQQGTTMNYSPGDVVWQVPTDVNPSKTITETVSVQATNPDGSLKFDTTGSPVWQTQQVENPDGTTFEQIVTTQVQNTYDLLTRPSIFTQSDISAVLISYKVVSQ